MQNVKEIRDKVLRALDACMHADFWNIAHGAHTGSSSAVSHKARVERSKPNGMPVFQRIVEKFFGISDRWQIETFLKLSGKPDRNKLVGYNTAQREAWEFQSKWLIAMSRVLAESLDNIEARLDHIEHRMTE